MNNTTLIVIRFSWPTLSAQSDTVHGLVAGRYGVIVTDANGCTLSATATLNRKNSIPLLNTGVTNLYFSMQLFQWSSVFHKRHMRVPRGTHL